MSQILDIAQLAVAVILIVFILLQERSGGATSGIFGGGEGTVYQTRRGLEKAVFVATIVGAIVFVALSLANLIL
jgi:protein translocase SecG subunit